MKTSWMKKRKTRNVLLRERLTALSVVGTVESMEDRASDGTAAVIGMCMPLDKKE